MEYFIIKNNAQQGPYSLAELRVLNIKATDKIWKQGMVQWAAASTLPELQPLFIVNPPLYNESIFADEEAADKPGILNTATICFLIYLGWEAALSMYWKWAYTFMRNSKYITYASITGGIITILLPVAFIFVLKKRKASAWLIVISLIKLLAFLSGWFIDNFF